MIRHLVKAQEATARTACKLFGIVNEANDQPTGRLNATWARAWSSIGPRGQRQASSPALTLGFTLATLAITLCLKLIFASLNSHFESMEQVRHYRDVHEFPRGRWCRRQIGVALTRRRPERRSSVTASPSRSRWRSTTAP
jgi:hypothetical protein